jgi:hypothetical protein
MRLGVVTATVGYWAGVQRLVESFYKFSDYETEFFIVPNLAKERSVSGAWNYGIQLAIEEECEFIVVANDDSYIADEEALPAVLHHMWDNDLWICRTYSNPAFSHHKGFHFFVIKPEIVDKVGFFDETFWPAYFEDDDYHYRCTLIDPTKTDKIMVNILHEESMTRKNMSREEQRELDNLVEANGARYANKWGGPPGHEQWKVPYEGLKEPEHYIGISYDGLIDYE